MTKCLGYGHFCNISICNPGEREQKEGLYLAANYDMKIDLKEVDVCEITWMESVPGTRRDLVKVESNLAIVGRTVN